jgi:uncharacterized protein DUF7019
MAAVRELVYLSNRKLEQFMLSRPRRWWQRAGVEGEVRLPGLGGVKVTRPNEPAERSLPELDRVIDALEQSERAARWFTEDGLRPGQWVHFEAQLNHSVMDEENFRSAVLFLQPGWTTSPTGRHLQLLLHGSAEHLVGAPPRPVQMSLEVYQGRFSDHTFFHNVHASNELRRSVRAVAGELDHLHHNPQPGEASEIDETIESDDWFAQTVATIVQRMDDRLSSATAAWMAGYARITATVLRPDYYPPLHVVVGTPLYVEYVEAPDPADG